MEEDVRIVIKWVAIWIVLGFFAIQCLGYANQKVTVPKEKEKLEEKFEEDDELPESNTQTSTSRPIQREVMSDEEQAIMADIDMKYSVKMYEKKRKMDPNFPPKGAIKWKDGYYYRESDFDRKWVNDAISDVYFPSSGEWEYVLKKGAKPIMPANPYRDERYDFE